MYQGTLSLTYRLRVELLLWFLIATCYVRVYMISSNMVTWITATHYVSCFIL